MMVLRYGVRSVRQGPGSEAETAESTRCRSAHSLTASRRSGATAWATMSRRSRARANCGSLLRGKFSG